MLEELLVDSTGSDVLSTLGRMPTEAKRPVVRFLHGMVEVGRYLEGSDD
ncbi:MAG: hypothetical protein QGH20_12360 [Candidatus Latescibacteria bacterium]|nr:hypothetical protein [Candidatus Latescibacterota bacterium]